MRFESPKNEVIPKAKRWLADASSNSNCLTNFHNKHTKDKFWSLEVLKICSSSPKRRTIYYTPGQLTQHTHFLVDKIENKFKC